MSINTTHDNTLIDAQLRAASLNKGEPYASLPIQSLIGALAKHGGMYTLLDAGMMNARIGEIVNTGDQQATGALLAKLQSTAASFFYRLVDSKPGYKIHSELMAYLAEPGKGNGVTYDTGVEPSPSVPAAFTFVGQFIDHDLTFNGMNLTAGEQGVVVQDEASPTIDLDSVYGPRANVIHHMNKHVFDRATGKFIHREVKDNDGKVVGYDVPRHTHQNDPNDGVAYIFDPRNDENQLVLQIHILVQRLHNKLIDAGFPQAKLGEKYDPKKVHQIINCVRAEVVATWQSFIRNDYMQKVIRRDVLSFVLEEMKKPALPNQPQAQYGAMKHKPYRDLVTGLNVVRMPHEFAIGFRFGHSQLRPMYLLNDFSGPDSYVLLFRDARLSAKVNVDLPHGKPIEVDGTDDLRGHRPLVPGHVIQWSVFYPQKETADSALQTHSMLIDHKVTARVFNLPETAIPDDIKYIGNLVHRNLIRSSQIGIVSGEELADFYGIARVPPEKIYGRDAQAQPLFELDSKGKDGHKEFKTPLWYYLLKEAEVSDQKGAQLGELGSRLVAEVLAGAMYYSNTYPVDENWQPFMAGVIGAKVTLQDIIKYVTDTAAIPASGA